MMLILNCFLNKNKTVLKASISSNTILEAVRLIPSINNTIRHRCKTEGLVDFCSVCRVKKIKPTNPQTNQEPAMFD